MHRAAFLPLLMCIRCSGHRLRARLLIGLIQKEIATFLDARSLAGYSARVAMANGAVRHVVH